MVFIKVLLLTFSFSFVQAQTLTKEQWRGFLIHTYPQLNQSIDDLKINMDFVSKAIAQYKILSQAKLVSDSKIASLAKRVRGEKDLEAEVVKTAFNVGAIYLAELTDPSVLPLTPIQNMMVQDIIETVERPANLHFSEKETAAFLNSPLGTFMYLFQTLLAVSLTDEQLDRVSENLKFAIRELMPAHNLYFERCKLVLEKETAAQLTFTGSMNFQLLGQVMKNRREQVRPQVNAFLKSVENK